MGTSCAGGGAEGDRTPDLNNAIVALSQLSYSPSARGANVREGASSVNEIEDLRSRIPAWTPFSIRCRRRPLRRAQQGQRRLDERFHTSADRGFRHRGEERRVERRQ